MTEQIQILTEKEIMRNWASRKCMVSIICTAFNHEKYIDKTLQGFLMQKTLFPFEVLIHDDASTDATSKIIKRYETEYPNIIRGIYQKENQFSKNIPIGKKFLYPKVQGKYVAECEGDDYWTDPYKIQKQVDFLEENINFSICFHPVKVIWENKEKRKSIFPTPRFRFNKKILSLNDLLVHNFIQTNSVMYRWRFNSDNLSLIPDNILPGDWFMHLLHAQIGKIGFIPNIMAVYRRNDKGIWYGAGTDPNWFCTDYEKKINFFVYLKKYFKSYNGNGLYDSLLKTSYAALILNREDIIYTLQKKYSFSPPKLPKYIFLRMCYLKIRYLMNPKSKLHKTNYSAFKLFTKWKKDR